MTLSRQQHRVLVMLANGLTVDDVAQRLGLSRQTVKNHIAVAYLRLRVKNRYQAFMELGWLTPPDTD